MFTDKELDILEFEIFPIVNKFNDLQTVFENLDEDQVELFSKWCEYEDIDISKIAIGTFWREENDVLYLFGFPKRGYKEYEGGRRPWSKKIKEVKTETSVILPENCKNMFDWCDKLESINVSNWNVSRVKNAYSMFYICRSLENLDVSKWDVSNVRNMSWMFSTCEKLENLDVSSWDVSNVEDMCSMFYSCADLENLDVSNWNVSNVRDTRWMFGHCKNLKEIKGILNWDLSSLEHSKSMFDDTSNLKDKDKILKKFGVK